MLHALDVQFDREEISCCFSLDPLGLLLLYLLQVTKGIEVVLRSTARAGARLWGCGLLVALASGLTSDLTGSGFLYLVHAKLRQVRPPELVFILGRDPPG